MFSINTIKNVLLHNINLQNVKKWGGKREKFSSRERILIQIYMIYI